MSATIKICSKQQNCGGWDGMIGLGVGSEEYWVADKEENEAQFFAMLICDQPRKCSKTLPSAVVLLVIYLNREKRLNYRQQGTVVKVVERGRGVEAKRRERNRDEWKDE